MNSYSTFLRKGAALVLAFSLFGSYITIPLAVHAEESTEIVEEASGIEQEEIGQAEDITDSVEEIVDDEQSEGINEIPSTDLGSEVVEEVVEEKENLPWYEESWPSSEDFPAMSEFPPFSEADFEEEATNDVEPMVMARGFAPSFSFFNRTLYIEKEVINDNLGTAEVTSFSVTVRSLTLSGFNSDEYFFDENGLIEISTPRVGLYSIIENEAPGYDVSYEDCNAFLITLLGGDHTCSITNNDTPPIVPECGSGEGTFDPFTVGTVHGQGGWSSTGSYDQMVVENIYGIDDFGCKSLRLSNAITSGSFGDQTFSYSLSNEAGESDAESGGQSGGTRQNYFEAEFDIASTNPSAQQPGLFLSVSPDRGDGARMSYLGFSDAEGGIDVLFYDVQGTTNPANFVPTTIATGLDRTVPHTVKFAIQFMNGPSNDVVEIYIDGDLVHTGTSWEDYYRFDDESNPTLVNTSRTVDSLLFRAGGAAAPGTSGEGFLFDNVTLTSETVPGAIEITKYVCPADTTVTRTLNGVGGLSRKTVFPRKTQRSDMCTVLSLMRTARIQN